MEGGDGDGVSEMVHPFPFFLALPAVYMESPHSPHYQMCLNDAVKEREKGFWGCKRFCDATFA
eukprot:1385809-Ditylum_brightwellii.AAC.1